MRNLKKNKEESVSFYQLKLEKNTWYFIELFHLNNKSKESLVLYVNNKQVHATAFTPYSYKEDYNENSIGCSVSAEGSYTDYFCGEMTALYFFEVNPKSCGQIHDYLCSMLSHVQIENILDAQHKIPIAERTFLHINPKYALASSTRRISALRDTKFFCSAAEKLLPQTAVSHNTSAKATFVAIGGVKAVLPVLYEAAKCSADGDFLYFGK